MKISREQAIIILKYLTENREFYFPFLVVCKEYSPEDDDFVEIEPEEWEDIENDNIYQTFELWENLQNIDYDTIKLLSKWYFDYMFWKSLKNKIQELFLEYDTYYKTEFIESSKILEYWENEFFWWKREAYEDILSLFEKYWI